MKTGFVTLDLPASDILHGIVSSFPYVQEVIEKARSVTQRGKQEVYEYQAAALYYLASDYSSKPAHFLEIGTYWGFTAAILAQAAPEADIITLNPTPWEWEVAQKNLRQFKHVRTLCTTSQDYLSVYKGELDFVFVDGDHKRVREDLPWWNFIKPGGLMIFHDYSPPGCVRQCPPVWRALHDFASYLGREPDVLVVDDQQVGMAGWYKREGDKSYDG